MIRCLQPIASASAFTQPARSFLGSRPSNVFCNLGALSQIAFKATAARDPDRPKLPASAYLRFVADYRAKNGLKGGKETISKAGAAWKSASLVDKAPFEKAYAQEKEVYTKAFQEYKDSGKLDAWKRDPENPKRPLTPYFSWALEKQKEPRFANVLPPEAAKMLKPEWDAIPATQKDALKNKYLAEMETFKTQKAAYDASPAKTAWLEKTGKMKDIKAAEAKKAKELEKKAAEKLKAEKKKQVAAAKKAKEAEKKAALKAKAAAKKAKELEKKAAEKLKAEKKKQMAAETKAKEKKAAKGKPEAKKAADKKATVAKKKVGEKVTK